MNKATLLHIILVFAVWNSFGQSIVCQNFIVQKDSVKYKIQTSDNIVTSHYILSYKIINNCDSIIWLWFEQKSILHKNNKLKEYFFGHKGDINLFHMLTDANVSIQDTVPILFNTFLKFIKPHDSFLIQIFCTEDIFRKKETIYNYLDEHVVIESNEILSKFLGVSDLEEWRRIKFYEKDFIIFPIELFDFK